MSSMLVKLPCLDTHLLGQICVFLCLTDKEPRSFKQPLIQYSCHEFGILDFQQLVPYTLPPPQAGRWRVGGWRRGKERKVGGGVLS